MKLNKPLIVELDGAKFTFKQPSLKEFFIDNQKKDGKDNITEMLNSLIAIEGVQDGDLEVTVEQFKQIDSTFDLVTVLKAYQAAVASFFQVAVTEKK